MKARVYFHNYATKTYYSFDVERPEGDEFFAFGAHEYGLLELLKGEFDWAVIKGPEFYPDPDRPGRWIVWPLGVKETRERLQAQTEKRSEEHPFLAWFLERASRWMMK